MSAREKNADLHGNAPDSCEVALILLDVINDFTFPTGKELREQAMPIAPRLRELIQRAKQAKIPVVYVNDNFGRWRSDFNAVVEHCLEEGGPGKDFVQMLKPTKDDYFVLKPKHSGFFGTTLDLLLQYLQASSVILTGLTGDMCVQFTAQDAYLRDLNFFVPADCTASATRKANDQAIDLMHRVLKADVRPATELNLKELACRV